jgi:protein-S-isoprenylcysteine O-methyltransferase Ste14
MTTAQDKAQVNILPPLIPLAALGIGILGHFILPIEIAPDAISRPVGAVAILLSVILVADAWRELRRARTAFDVRRPTTALVRSGVFGFSRNPVYLSMLLLCFGIAFLVNSVAMALAAIPAGSALCLLVIRREESYLERKFGGEYLTYKTAVRRWF